MGCVVKRLPPTLLFTLLLCPACYTVDPDTGEAEMILSGATVPSDPVTGEAKPTTEAFVEEGLAWVELLAYGLGIPVLGGGALMARNAMKRRRLAKAKPKTPMTMPREEVRKILLEWLNRNPSDGPIDPIATNTPPTITNIDNIPPAKESTNG